MSKPEAEARESGIRSLMCRLGGYLASNPVSELGPFEISGTPEYDVECGSRLFLWPPQRTNSESVIAIEVLS